LVVGDSVLELVKNIIHGKIKDSGIKNVSILKNLGNSHVVLEWIDLELIKKSSLSTINLGVLENNLLLNDNFNLRLYNSGLDLKSLEETSLLGIKSCFVRFLRIIKSVEYLFLFLFSFALSTFDWFFFKLGQLGVIFTFFSCFFFTLFFYLCILFILSFLLITFLFIIGFFLFIL